MDREIREGAASTFGHTLGRTNYRTRTRTRTRTDRFNEFILMATLHTMHLAFIALMIGLIQVKYQNTKDSPFETDSTLMIISVIALALYGLAVGFKIIQVLDTTDHTNKSYGQSIVTFVTPIFGGLSSVSFLSVLIQDKLPRFMFLIWTISIGTVAYYSFKLISQLICNIILKAIFQAINMLRNTYTNFMGFRSIQQEHSIGTTASV